MSNGPPSDKDLNKNLYRQFNNLGNANVINNDDFERELNERLNHIKQKQNSQRKFKAYQNQKRSRNLTSGHTLTEQIYASSSPNQASKLDRRLTQNIFDSKQSNPIQSLKQHKYINYDDISDDLEINSNRYSHTNKYKSSRSKQQQQSKPRITIKQKLFQVPEYRNILSNQSTIGLIDKYFQGQQQISVNQFVKALAAETGETDKLKQSQMNVLIERMRKDLTTTDPQVLSLNALQILNKKTDLKSYFIAKLTQAKFSKKKKDLEVSYKELLENYKQKQQQLQIRKQKIQKKEYELKQRQGQIYNKEKHLREKQARLSKKERQLMDRDKNIKVVLKQKSQKLMQDYKKQIQKLINVISAKSVAFQKNAKMKLQTVQRKIDDLKQLKLLEQTIAKQKNNQSRNPHQQFINRIRKLERDIQKNNQIYTQNLAKLQQENKEFLKASSILQSKVQKLKQKLKNEKSENQSKADLIKNLEFQLKQKTQVIQQLLTNARHSSQNIQGSLHRSSPGQGQIIKKQSQQGSQTVKISRANRNRKLSKNSKEEKKNVKCKMLIDFYQHLLKIVFENLNAEGRQKIQAILTRQVQQIVDMSVPVVLILVSENIQTKFIPQFIVKTISMVCGLFKYQQNLSLKQMLDSSQDYQSSRKKFIAKVHSSKVSILLQSIQKKNYPKIVQYLKHQKIDAHSIMEYVVNANNFESSSNQLGVDRNSPEGIYLCLYLSLFKPIQFANQQKDFYQCLSISSLSNINDFQLAELLISSQDNIDELLNLLCFKFIQPVSRHINQNDNSCYRLQDGLAIIDVFLQACHSQKFIKQLYSIQNYKILIKTMLKLLSSNSPKKKLKITDQVKKQQNKQKIQGEICQKITIIIQRLVYMFSEQVQITKNEISQIKEIIRQRQGNQKQQDQLLVANLKSIISGVQN